MFKSIFDQLFSFHLKKRIRPGNLQELDQSGPDPIEDPGKTVRFEYHPYCRSHQGDCRNPGLKEAVDRCAEEKFLAHLDYRYLDLCYKFFAGVRLS